ncbi:MAG: ABC transporter ATP-binding protein [Thaumarchaeota archaeon]|nr:ABC transporter ATP-binding protein [Nitrososphaerota archaeon]
MLDAKGVTKNFGGVRALSDVDFRVEKGERLGLIGPNGSGKTTLLSIIAGTIRTDKGRLAYKGRDITRVSPHKRAKLGIGRTFQIPKPLSSMTLLDNVIVPLVFIRGLHNKDGETSDVALELLQQVGLSAKASLRPKQLTQLELREMELARALAGKPELLLLDEVLAGLTSGEADDVVELLRGLNGRGIAIVMVEHIMRAVMGFSQRIVVLDFGVKIAEGDPEEISNDPEVLKAYIGE